jgi:hypothetical protein
VSLYCPPPGSFSGQRLARNFGLPDPHLKAIFRSQLSLLGNAGMIRLLLKKDQVRRHVFLQVSAASSSNKLSART